SQKSEIFGLANPLADFRLEPDRPGSVQQRSAHLRRSNGRSIGAYTVSAHNARNTQIYLQQETGITHVVDPWAGSYYVERLTHELMHAAWRLIEEVEQLGGMAKAIETGIPKMRIER